MKKLNVWKRTVAGLVSLLVAAGAAPLTELGGLSANKGALVSYAGDYNGGDNNWSIAYVQDESSNDSINVDCKSVYASAEIGQISSDADGKYKVGLKFTAPTNVLYIYDGQEQLISTSVDGRVVATASVEFTLEEVMAAAMQQGGMMSKMISLKYDTEVSQKSSYSYPVTINVVDALFMDNNNAKVCRIEDNSVTCYNFEALKAAVKYAEDGETIHLGSDIKMSSDGHENSELSIEDNKKLVIDGSQNNDGKYSIIGVNNESKGIIVNGKGSLTLENIKFANISDPISLSLDDGKLILKNVDIDNCKGNAVKVNAGAKANVVAINCNITRTEDYAFSSFSSDTTIDIRGGKYDCARIANMNNGKLIIRDGEFSKWNNESSIMLGDQTATANIIGGIFSTEPTKYIDTNVYTTKSFEKEGGTYYYVAVDTSKVCIQKLESSEEDWENKVPVYYKNLRAAVAANESTQDIALGLIADDTTSFTAEQPNLVINKNITVIGFSFDAEGKKPSIKGITDYTGTETHGIVISSPLDGDYPSYVNVNFENVNLTEFGNASEYRGNIYPILIANDCSGSIRLTNVNIDKFNGTAVKAIGRAATVHMDGCKLTGRMTSNTTDPLYQSGVETVNGTINLNDCTITGMGSTLEDNALSKAACIQVSNVDNVNNGAGRVTVGSGIYDGDYAVIIAGGVSSDYKPDRLTIWDGEFDGKISYEQPISPSESGEATPLPRPYKVTVLGGVFSDDPTGKSGTESSQSNTDPDFKPIDDGCRVFDLETTQTNEKYKYGVTFNTGIDISADPYGASIDYNGNSTIKLTASADVKNVSVNRYNENDERVTYPIKYTYQWSKKNDSNEEYTNIDEATAKEYTVGPGADKSGNYKCTVKSGTFEGFNTKQANINKKDLTADDYTAPTAKAGLTYNGEAKQLIEAGGIDDNNIKATGAKLEYGIEKDAIKGTGQPLNMDDIKVGNVYTIGDLEETLEFPSNVYVKFGEETLYQSDSCGVYLYYNSNNVLLYDPVTHRDISLGEGNNAIRVTDIAGTTITVEAVKLENGKYIDWTDDATKVTGTNAGDYNVFYRITGSSAYNDVAPEQIQDVKIAKAASAFDKAPAAKSGLEYNGSDQELVSDYAFNTLAGKDGLSIQFGLSRQITKYKATRPDLKLNAEQIKEGDVCYCEGTTEQYIAFPEDFSIKLGDKTHKAGDGSVIIALSKSGGYELVYYNSNYDIIHESLGAGNNGVQVTGIDIDNKIITVEAVNSENVKDNYTKWSDSVPKAKNAGDYEVSYRVTGAKAKNYAESEAKPIQNAKIDKASPLAENGAPKAIQNLKYNRQEQVLTSRAVLSTAAEQAELYAEFGIEDTTILSGKGDVEYNINELHEGDICTLGQQNDTFHFPNGYKVAYKDVLPTEVEPNQFMALTYKDSDVVFGINSEPESALQLPPDTDALQIVSIDKDSKLITVKAVDKSTTKYIKWSPANPTAIEAGEYNVYYRVKGNENFVDVEKTKIEGTKIEALPSAIDKLPTALTLNYNGGSQALIQGGTLVTGVTDTKFEYCLGRRATNNDIVWGYQLGDAGYTITDDSVNKLLMPNGTNSISMDNVEHKRKLIIGDMVYDLNNAKLRYSDNGGDMLSIGYTDDASKVYDLPVGCNALQIISVNDTIVVAKPVNLNDAYVPNTINGKWLEYVPTEKAADQYVVFYRVADTDDYLGVLPTTLNASIAKVSAFKENGTPSAADLTYNGNEQELVSDVELTDLAKGEKIKVQYGFVKDATPIKGTGDEIDRNTVKVGNVYSVGDDGKRVYFPEGWKVKCEGETYEPAPATSVYLYEFYGNTILTCKDNDDNKHERTFDGNYGLEVTAVGTDEITVKPVELANGKSTEWLTAGEKPKATDAGEYNVVYRVTGDNAKNYIEADNAVTIANTKIAPKEALQTPPTAKNLKVKNYEQELVGAGELAQDAIDAGVTIKYGLGVKPSRTVITDGQYLEAAAIDVGEVYDFSSRACLAFPHNYTVKVTRGGVEETFRDNDTSINNGVVVNLTENGYKEISDCNTEPKKMLLAPDETLMVTKIDINAMTVYVDVVTAVEDKETNSIDYVSWSTDIPKAKDLGTYTVYYKVEGNPNYVSIAPTKLVSKIDTAPAALATDGAPKAKTGLKYQNKDTSQALVEAGTLIQAAKDEGGKILYGIGTEQYIVEQRDYHINNDSDAEIKPVVGRVYKIADGIQSGSIEFDRHSYAVKFKGNIYSGGGLSYNAQRSYYFKADNDVEIPLTEGYDALRVTEIDTTSGELPIITLEEVKSSECYDVKEWTETVPTATEAGTYAVFYKIEDTATYVGVEQTKIADVVIEKITAYEEAPKAVEGLEYNKNSQVLCGSGEVKQDVDRIGTQFGIAKPVTIINGTNEPLGTVKEGNVYCVGDSGESVKFPLGYRVKYIDEYNNTYTIPVYSSDSVKLNGSSDYACLNTYTSATGSMSYSLLNGNDAVQVTEVDDENKIITVVPVKKDEAKAIEWSTEGALPSGTDAGDYEIYYRVVDNQYSEGTAKNYTDSEPTLIPNAKIAKASPVATAPEAKTVKYNRQAQKLITEGTLTDDAKNAGAVIEYGIAKPVTPISGCGVIYDINDVKVGNVYKPTSKDNDIVFPLGYSFKYEGDEYSADAGLRIGLCLDSSDSPCFYVEHSVEKHYHPDMSGNDAYEIVAVDTNKQIITIKAVKGETATAIKWSESAPTATEVGTYSVYYRVKGTDNYADVAQTSLGDAKINIKPDAYQFLPSIKGNLEYDRTEKELVNTIELRSKAIEEGAKIEYALGKDIDIIEGNDITIGAGHLEEGTILKPTGSEGITFDNGIVVKFAGTSVGYANGRLLNVDSNHVRFSYGNDKNIDLDNGKDALRITNIEVNQMDTVLTVEQVKAEDCLVPDAENWSTDIPKATNAGKYHIFYRISDTENYLGVPERLLGTAEIAKINAITEAPKAVDDLTYDGKDKTLVTAGKYADFALKDQVKVEFGTKPTVHEVADQFSPEIGDIIVGDVYKPIDTGSYKFPNGYTLDIDGFDPMTPKEQNGVYVSNSSGDLISTFDKISVTLSGDAIRVTDIDIEGQVISIELVDTNNINSLLSWSTELPTAVDAKDYDVYYRLSGYNNYNDVAPTRIENVKIAKAAPTLTAPVDAECEYTSLAQELVTGADVENGTIKYALTTTDVTSADDINSESWGSDVPQGTDVGTYRVWFKVVGDKNYSDIAPNYVDATIVAQRNILTSAPVLASNPKYRSSAVNLITAPGTPKFGNAAENVHYAVTKTNTAPGETANWTSYERITANATGTYYIWYKTDGMNETKNNGCTGVGPVLAGTVTVSRYVAPTPLYLTQTWTLSMNSYEYDGTAHIPTIEGTTYGNVTYTYYNEDTGAELSGAPSAVGNYKVVVTADGGSDYYSRTREATYSITKSSSSDVDYKYRVEVKNGTVNDAATGEFEAGTILVVKSNEAPSGKKFGFWRRNGVTVSYNPNYTFKLSTENVTLEAVYLDADDEFDVTGNCVKDSVTIDKANRKITFSFMNTVPENCSIINAGIVATSDMEQSNDLRLGNAEYEKVYTTTVHNFKYNWTKSNVQDGQAWYVKGYLTYKNNSTGEIETIYSPMEKATLNGSQTIHEDKIVGTALNDGIVVNKADSKITFSTLLNVPADCTITKAGLVATNVKSDSENLTIANAKFVKGSASTKHTVRYNWTKTNVGGSETWYVRPYLVYIDSLGTERTVYGDVVSASLNS